MILVKFYYFTRTFSKRRAAGTKFGGGQAQVDITKQITPSLRGLSDFAAKRPNRTAQGFYEAELVKGAV